MTCTEKSVKFTEIFAGTVLTHGRSKFNRFNIFPSRTFLSNSEHAYLLISIWYEKFPRNKMLKITVLKKVIVLTFL